jgi:hypothetical protein
MNSKITRELASYARQGQGGIKMLTFKKRQKEMKRLEKQREKAERRAQKKLAKRAEAAAIIINSENDRADNVQSSN